MTLAPELIASIIKDGPLTVAEYMEQCNTHYYATRDPLGAQGDFTTSPEISQIFGELIGAWIADIWQTSGAPKAIFCELGPGRGTLMKDALRATRSIPNFHANIEILLIETSPVLRTIQQQNLKDAHHSIHWHESLDHLPALPLFIIANEFFDALPIRQEVKVGAAWEERKVDYANNEFIWWPEGGKIRETSPVSLAVMSRIATHIQTYGGAALIIDYGYTGGSRENTLQAVYKHQYANPLEIPGEVDLTAHVDFTALAKTAAKVGTKTSGAVEQGTFLKRLGAELRAAALCKNASPEQQKNILSALERLVAPHQMGELFKVMAIVSSKNPLSPAGF